MLKYHQLPQRGSNRDSFAALPQEDSIGVANYPLTVKNQDRTPLLLGWLILIFLNFDPFLKGRVYK